MSIRHVYPFEKLRVWESSRELVKIVSGATLRLKIESVSRQLNALRKAQVSQ
jgi:hypothetical protein